jgi:hypothetical protein
VRLHDPAAHLRVEEETKEEMSKQKKRGKKE